MCRGTGVFIPAYAAQAKQCAEGEAFEDSATNNKHSSKRRSADRSRSHNSSFRAAASHQQVINGPLHAYSSVSGTAAGAITTAPCMPDQQMDQLCLQQLPSPAPSLCSSSDLDILAAASDARFTSSCSSLLAPGFSSPFAAYPAAEDVATSPCSTSSAAAIFNVDLAAATPTASDLTQLLLLEQQEAEVDAAIFNLIALKQQLAAIQQQPILPALPTASYSINQFQQQGLVGGTPYLPVTAAPAAGMGTWAGGLVSEGDVLLALDAASAQQAQLQQLAPESNYLPADLLQLLAGL